MNSPDEQEYPKPKSIGDYIRRVGETSPKPAAKRGNSERAQLIAFFTERINKARSGTRWKPLTPTAVNLILAKRYPGKSLQPLYALKAKCLEADARELMPFSAQFWIEVRAKGEPSPKKSGRLPL